MEPDKQIYGILQNAESSNGRTLYRYKISDETVNRNGWKIITDGIEFSEYLKTGPVFLAQHDEQSIPIGKIENIFAEGTVLYADVWYHEENDTSKLYKKLVDLEIIKSVSIGITVLEEGPSIPVTEANRAKIPVWIDTIHVFARTRLREISQVNIPANAGTVLRKIVKAAWEGQKITNDEKNWCDNNFHSYYKLTDLTTNNGVQDMDLAVENANLKNDLKNLTAERDSIKSDYIKANDEKKRLVEAQELLKRENAELKKNFEDIESKLKTANETIAEAQHRAISLEIDNFIAKNKEKILPKENENDMLKNKLLQLKMNESIKLGDKTLFEYECSLIEAREPGLGLTGEMVQENSTKKIENTDVDFTTKTLDEVFSDAELSEKFSQHCVRVASASKIPFDVAYAQERLKLKV